MMPSGFSPQRARWVETWMCAPGSLRSTYLLVRAMLADGIAHLRGLGATSITLGVDADNPAPFRLYQSVGFRVASSMDVWDKVL